MRHSSPCLPATRSATTSAKDAARMLLLINIRQEQPRKIVQYFEVVKEKAPELVLSVRPVAGDRQGLSRHQRI